MDRYSQFVALLKVLLPLTALALLSTLFLLSRTIEPVSTIPFAETEINDRVRDQQITTPFFSGTTDTGDLVTLTAETLRQTSGTASRAEEMSAQIDLASGTRVVLLADSGSFDMGASQSQLAGNVIVTTSTGYRVLTDALAAELDRLRVESPGPVTATGPLGRLDAGQMRMEKQGPENSTHLIFTNGVKLLYDPGDLEE